MALYDYEQIMQHPAPEPVRFKFKGSLGVTYYSRFRALGPPNFKPYVEDRDAFNNFQVDSQGLSFNFESMPNGKRRGISLDLTLCVFAIFPLTICIGTTGYQCRKFSIVYFC